MQIGKVRPARRGEIPTHYAGEAIKAGEGVIATVAAMPQHFGERTRRAINVVEISFETPYRAAYLARKRRNRIGWSIVAIAILAGVALWATFAHADTLTYVATPAPVAQPTIIHDAVVTAYTSSPDETDDTPFITASGAHTTPGEIACPSKYAFGTQVKIHDAIYTCEDRMNAIYADQEHFDVWVYTKDEAYEWGHQTLDVEILPAQN